eukprot:11581622-Alexandrium_andersonii.AAC.1
MRAACHAESVGSTKGATVATVTASHSLRSVVGSMSGRCWSTSRASPFLGIHTSSSTFGPGTISSQSSPILL